MDIASLVERCLGGDDEGWWELIKLYAPIVFALCRKNRLSSDEALDIFGEVNYKILVNRKSLKSKEKFLSYVHQIALHEIRHMQRDIRTHDGLAEMTKEALYAESQEDALDHMIKEERIRKLIEALRKLPEHCKRLIFLLFYQDTDLKHGQVAERLGRPKSSISPSQIRCLKKLRKFFEDFGEDEDF